MSTWLQDWLIGSNGLYHGVIGGAWTRVGYLTSGISSLLREPERLVAGACQGSGLWEWPHQAGYWKQLHDETLTEVMAVASIDGNPGVVAGSSFCISTGRRDDTGAVRWTHLSDMLNVNERFTNAIQIDPADSSRWLIGTEAGVLIAQAGGTRWTRSSLIGTPVRALTYAHGLFWAGTDDRGAWHSADGLTWSAAGHSKDGGAIYDLAACNGSMVAATVHGVTVGDESGYWRQSGPRMLCAAVAVHPDKPNVWMAGATPGGLWSTEDAGHTWKQIAGFVHVQAILPPEGGLV